MFEGTASERLAFEHAIVLTALYLRGLARPFPASRRGWPAVAASLRRSCLGVAQAEPMLRKEGFGEEAAILATPGLLERAERLHRERKVLTASDALYPSRWLERMHGLAPPALWWNGAPFAAERCFTIVGSRSISRRVGQLVEQFGAAMAERGYLVVSGGAAGCDRAGVRGALSTRAADDDAPAAPCLEVLPYGLDWGRQCLRRIPAGAALSVCEPDAEFSAGQAMERNTLLYAASPFTLVGHARLKEGGTWTGAIDALRRRLSRLLVLDIAGAEGNHALAALGGHLVRRPEDVEPLFVLPELQPSFVFEEETLYAVPEPDRMR